MWHCDATQQGWLVNKITFKVLGIGQRDSVFNNYGTGQYIWESGQGQIHYQKKHFLLFPIKDRRTELKWNPVWDKSHQAAVRQWKGEDWGTFWWDLHWRDPGVYIIFLMFVLSVRTVHIIFSVALLLRLPPTVQKHEDQVDEVLSSMRVCELYARPVLNVWPSPGCLPPSVTVTTGKDNRTPCSNVKRMDGWMSMGHACLNCLTLLTFSCYLDCLN